MTLAARVVPDVTSYSVDDGFWYSIPEHLAADVVVGRIVRVPLSGRKVRGWVVEVADVERDRLKAIAAVSGSYAVFDARHLESLRWAATHYLAPVAALLSRATPPNLPRKRHDPSDPVTVGEAHHPLGDIARRTARGRTNPVTALVGNWRTLDWITSLRPVLEGRRSVLVVAAAAAEASMVGEEARRLLGECVAVADGEDDKSDTFAWELAQSAPRLLVGTPKTASWQIAELGLAVVLEEGRRAMKDRQTPTIHVRELVRTRSRVEGFNLVFFGPTPSVELLAAGAEIQRVSPRAWPLVEVVDRSDDAPGAGYLSPRTVAALQGAARSGKRSFVFTHRRAGSGSTRCARCRRIRECAKCERRVGTVERCPRCDTILGPCVNCGSEEFEEMGTIPERLVAELERKLGKGLAAIHPTDAPIGIGTERDLTNLGLVDLAVAADVDGMLMGVGYRTSEEAIRQLGRLASSVRPKSGSRLMIQTSHPESDLVTTMRRGDPVPYLERVLVQRARDGAPPAAEMLIVEVRGEMPDEAESEIRSVGSDVDVLGPMPVESGVRWLLTGRLAPVRPSLRALVGRWRDRGATVRVDADPIDV